MADETPPTQAPPVAPAAVQPAPAAPAQITVPMPLEQVQAFTAMQARLAQLEAENRTREQTNQAEQARLLAQRGEVENALNLVRNQSQQDIQAAQQRADQASRAASRYALDGELSRALASAQLVPNGAEQLAQLWRGNFTATAENGTYAVRTATYETPAQFVQAQLARPEYAHFVRANNPAGGTAGSTTTQTPPAPATPTPPPQPKNMGEAVILHMQSMQKAQGDPRANLGLPMGLKPTPRTA